jgi:hypothetical protein
MESQHPTLINLRRQIELLELDNATLRNERDRLYVDHEKDVENIRDILLDALSADQRDYVDIDILANSIADVLGIELTKTVNVIIHLNVEASMTVPAHFDVSDLTLTDVGMDSDNIDVDNFSVDSWDVFGIEQN